jgi:hypothetical protein
LLLNYTDEARTNHRPRLRRAGRVLVKLGLRTRTQVTAWAGRRAPAAGLG